jgi:hypothetical protein
VNAVRAVAEIRLVNHLLVIVFLLYPSPLLNRKAPSSASHPD